MDDFELKYWIAFNRVPHVGRARFMLLENYFGTLERAWSASQSTLEAAGLDVKSAKSIVARRPSIEPDREIEKLHKAGVRAITWHDSEYPPRLKEIYDLPPVLYIKGDLLPEDERSVAIVGTRKTSAYGREATQRLSSDLARAGVTIISGLARGVDAIAHKAALDAGQRTIAVLGCGVDVIYPREHTNLASGIIQNGALISEHPIGTRPDAQNFPRRNRIISGMTLGTIVVEAPESSGALITAQHALAENREVFAVPGDIIRPSSRGSNKLIRDSAAKLVLDYNDVLEELNLTSVSQQIEMAAVFPDNKEEVAVLRYVTYDPVHIDEVIRNSGLNISTVSSTLTMMELKGLVKQVGGMNYIRVRETSAEYQIA